MSTFSSDQLPELLSVFYKRLFPYGPYYRWLSYGLVNPNAFANREMSFTLPGDIYIRYQSFDKLEDFEHELQRKCPEKIDIGGIYNIKPRLKRMTSTFEVEEKELVFDIDITDYDSVRTCCKYADVCSKCWKLMSIATKILDTSLRDDFGFKHILWVFSGRRGVHCWVCDDTARKLDSKVRSDIAEYLQLLSREDHTGKVAHIPPEIVHPSVKRALKIIKQHFMNVCIEGQDLLGTSSGMNKMLGLMDENLRAAVEPKWEKLTNSVERWNAFVAIFEDLLLKGQIKRRSKYLIDEIMLQYAYPRLDINVTKGSNHLLKSPFCIHPKTGKVCIPFNPANAFSFNPDSVPTISTLVDEIQEFDAKEASIGENEDRTKRKVKDYKKTSMYKGMQVFEEFLRNLESTWKNKRNNDSSMEF
ncbi:DNA primase small subunit [Cimex lectularius]|uniref:DNA primase n=1 Tax=Cimex lectularius TaxID=79782 RepID=A0A8I6RWQ6_CIMLE|nr:DNA primase small subunit [Cimex lectularius]